MASSLDLARYDGIVCVSGDGVLVEVGNTQIFCTMFRFAWLAWHGMAGVESTALTPVVVVGI